MFLDDALHAVAGFEYAQVFASAVRRNPGERPVDSCKQLDLLALLSLLDNAAYLNADDSSGWKRKFLDLLNIHYGSEPRVSTEIKGFRNRVASLRQVRNDRAHAAAGVGVTSLEADIAVAKILDFFVGVVVPTVTRHSDVFQQSTRDAIQQYVDVLLVAKNSNATGTTAETFWRSVVRKRFVIAGASILAFIFLWTILSRQSEHATATTRSATPHAQPWRIAMIGSQPLNSALATELSKRLQRVIGDSTIVHITAFGGNGVVETYVGNNANGLARFFERNSRIYYHWRQFRMCAQLAIDSLVQWNQHRARTVFMICGDLPEFNSIIEDSLRREGADHVLLPQQEDYVNLEQVKHVWFVRTSSGPRYIDALRTKMSDSGIQVVDVRLGDF